MRLNNDADVPQGFFDDDDEADHEVNLHIDDKGQASLKLPFEFSS